MKRADYLLCLIVFVFASGIVLTRSRFEVSVQVVSDVLFFCSMCLFVVSAIRVIRTLRFFESTQYGFMKLVEIIRRRDYSGATSGLPDRHEYANRPRVIRSPGVPFLCGVGTLVLSVVLALVW